MDIVEKEAYLPYFLFCQNSVLRSLNRIVK